MNYIRKLIILITVISALIVTVSTVSAASKTTECVNLMTLNKNTSGNGYVWDNINQILTIHGLNIDTSDSYGLKLRDGSTLIVEGNCSIKSSGTALYTEGSINIRGSGKLTLNGNEYGIVNNSPLTTDKITISSVTLNVTGNTSAIKSDNARFQSTGAVINLSGKGQLSIQARDIVIGGSSELYASAPLYASHLLSIDDSKAEIESGSSALVSDGELIIKQVDISVGSNKSELRSVSEYSGEPVIHTTPNVSHATHSILFGDNHSIFLDILVLIGIIAVLASIIVLPIWHKKKKLDKINSVKNS